MKNNNTKYWAFTWEKNKLQKKLPQELSVKLFLDGIVESAVFQLERGEKKGTDHYQGSFTLIGPRTSKIQLLNTFRERFKNISGLTLSKVYDKKAVSAYCQKEETRVAGPWFAGSKEWFDMETSNMELKNWQKDLYNYLLLKKEDASFRSRKVIWCEDHIGNTGKSYFLKWLRTGQRKVIARKLPVNSVERLISAVSKVVDEVEVDLFMIDITRTKGKEQSYEDLFAAIEDIINGYVVDVMFGKYVEAVFKPPLILVFTNLRMIDFRDKLSVDRWVRLGITPEQNIELWKTYPDGRITPFKLSELSENKTDSRGNESVSKSAPEIE